MSTSPPTITYTTGVALGDAGPLVLETDIDGWFLDALHTWLPTYLRLFEEARGLEPDSLPRPAPRDVTSVVNDLQFPDKMLPAVLTQTIGTEGDPKRHPDGTIEGCFRVQVTCVVRGRLPIETRFHAAVYRGVTTQILLQQGVIGYPRVVFKASGIEALPFTGNEGRYLAAARSQWWIYVDEIAQAGGGPTVPDAETYLPFATITEVDVDIESS